MKLNNVTSNYFDSKKIISENGKKQGENDLFAKKMNLVNRTQGYANESKLDTYTRSEETQNVYPSYSEKSYGEQFEKELEEYAEYVHERIEKGPEKIQIGAACMSIDEWKELLAKVDKYIDEMKASMRADIEKRMKELEEKKLQQEKDDEHLMNKVSSLLEDRLSNTPKAPYYYMADESGIIDYNGVVFVCDNEHQALCLGDMSNEDNVLTIPLSKGGTLKVNRDNLGELSKAISMFSAEDINLIMRAITLDAKIQKMKEEIDETISEVGRKISESGETEK